MDHKTSIIEKQLKVLIRQLEWLVVGDCEKELARIGYNIPVIKKIAYSDLFLTNPNHPEGFNKIFMDEVEYTIPSPLTPHAPKDFWKHSKIMKQQLITRKI